MEFHVTKLSKENIITILCIRYSSLESLCRNYFFEKIQKARFNLFEYIVNGGSKAKEAFVLSTAFSEVLGAIYNEIIDLKCYNSLEFFSMAYGTGFDSIIDNELFDIAFKDPNKDAVKKCFEDYIMREYNVLNVVNHNIDEIRNEIEKS